MAKPFSTLKVSKLAPTDQIPLGKLRGKRICDVWNEYYDYLIWLHKAGLVLYNVETMDGLFKIAGYNNQVDPKPDKEWQDSDVPF